MKHLSPIPKSKMEGRSKQVNIMTWVKKFNRFLLPGLLVICLLLNIIPAATALAANSPSITVGPDIVSNDTLMPGSFYAQPLTVSSIEPVTISIAGLGQTVGERRLPFRRQVIPLHLPPVPGSVWIKQHYRSEIINR